MIATKGFGPSFCGMGSMPSQTLRLPSGMYDDMVAWGG